MADDTPENDAPAKELDPMTTSLQAQGFAVVGDFPANLRLRAEAMSAAGVTHDDLGYVTDAEILAAGERIAAEAKEREDAERAEKRELRSMSLADLRATATAEGVAIEGDANKKTIADAIEAARAAKLEG